ncbi:MULTISPECIES: Gfo/Idh/MocA family protein [unclassified Rhizobium]|uniref:Gfo/Idh/MocA family protein n=1 Tax=unclassified Rhizobium TaxID=2613769 RepID=UPI001ADABF39|nr:MULTISPECIES: Gfo/Idh/MocA family oxidoreductase [unclassified Rhizobium]MBO9127486.1 Gfo/Idh/MocA family oxidoreductase [Rhizobium sp. 16-488-2b]MBO9177929.1 Gfo/Idh/MocA family oxidoreductase [Rhizobium sp. 16-488-2a]
MLRWGILGTSFISNTVAEAINGSDGSVIGAVFGRDPERLAAFADRYGIAVRHSSIDAIVDDPDIDVIYVGLPNNVHHDAVIEAAARGKPVLSEKSLTTTMEEAHALAAAVEQADIFFLEGLMYLSHPAIAELGNIIRSGRLGTIRSISGAYAADIWRVVNPAGGGTLYNLGCYPASLMHYVIQTAFGAEAFADRVISGHGNRSSHDGNICDAALTARFGSGVLATLQSTDSYGMAFDFTVRGDRASVRFLTNPWLPVAGDNLLEIEEYGLPTERIVVPSDHDAFGHQIRLVEDCLRKGLKQAPRPSPRLSDSIEIMQLLTEWERCCRA